MNHLNQPSIFRDENVSFRQFQGGYFPRLGSGTSMHFWRDVAVNETSVAFECAGGRKQGGTGVGDLVLDLGTYKGGAGSFRERWCFFPFTFETSKDEFQIISIICCLLYI